MRERDQDEFARVRNFKTRSPYRPRGQSGQRWAALSFRALVVVGDGKGRVGVGVGKSREVPGAIRQGTDRAKRNMVNVSLFEQRTLPHEVWVKFGASKVLLKPASPGTGVIAGGGVRAVVEAAGVKDVLSKSLGSSNVFNVVMATFKGLQELRDIQAEAEMRGKAAQDLLTPWRTGTYGD